MDDFHTEVLRQILRSRQKAIIAGTKPDTLKISKQFIEKSKVFGLNVEIVDSTWLPDGVELMVYEEGRIYKDGRVK